ncbi:MAG: RelA/SpoT family protein, partial [Nitrospinota bacterium]
MARLEDITEEVLKYNPDANIDLIWKAYVYSAKVHSGQVRASGEPYLSHPIDVAHLLTRFKMDTVSIMVGLLHDTIEDTYSTEEEIKALFGEEVLFLVSGLTKISKIEFSSEEEKQAENYRKMILAMSKDIRVIVIKLCDRLHNMRTLNFTPVEKQRRIARETLDIYAPVANRLGIGWVKQELEDLALQFLHPDEYERLKKSVDTHYGERKSYINDVIGGVTKNLQQADIKAEVDGRPKHFYSIYKKMVRKKIAFEQVYDLIGIRILTDSLKDCYSALGTIHHLWKPIPGKIKDYIAIPKRNMYQSLHTTVIGPKGNRVEFQIRHVAGHFTNSVVQHAILLGRRLDVFDRRTQLHRFGPF